MTEHEPDARAMQTPVFNFAKGFARLSPNGSIDQRR